MLFFFPFSTLILMGIEKIIRSTNTRQTPVTMATVQQYIIKRTFENRRSMLPTTVLFGTKVSLGRSDQTNILLFYGQGQECVF